MTLAPNRELLNPRFEGYKLNSSVSKNITSVKSQYPLDIDQIAPNTNKYSFQKLQERAYWNHLYNNPFDQNSCFYIDETYSLIKVTLELEQFQLFTMKTPTLEPEKREYPSIYIIDQHNIVISDGCGSIFWILNLELKQKFEFGYPLVLVCATIDKNQKPYFGVYSSFENENKELIYKYQVVNGEFNVTGKSWPLLMNILDDSSVLIGSQSEFQSALDIKKQAPAFNYQWFQTSTDLTIRITLETSIETRFVHALFQPKHLLVSIVEPRTKLMDSVLYDSIVPSECIWTLENGNILTIYLQKASEFKWMQVFEHDDQVLETMDPSTLNSINDYLEKYTGPENDEQEDLQGQRLLIKKYSTDSVTVSTGHEFISKGLENQVLLAHDVDGLVFSIPEMTHVATFNAMNFVKNSKREKRLVIYTRDYSMWLIAETKRYIYIYSSATKNEQSDQFVVDLSNETSEKILGLREISVGKFLVLTTDCLLIIE